MTYFNPRTPCGVRQTEVITVSYHDLLFQSTHPVRGATVDPGTKSGVWDGFQSTHPVRGATIGDLADLTTEAKISIHAPRAGCDDELRHMALLHAISIHAPRAGCDLSEYPLRSRISHFNPRTPCGVRLAFALAAAWFRHFNPRTPCGVRLLRLRSVSQAEAISIHAPRAGCDAQQLLISKAAEGFQSTHPVRGATGAEAVCISSHGISIHAPRAGCDFINADIPRVCVISIHAPRAGCDV